MIALQLYTVRDALKADFDGTMRQIAAMGYTHVETAGEFGGSPEHARSIFDQLGITACSAHSPLPLRENQQRVLETAAALGVDTLVFPWIAADNFTTLDGVKRVADMLTEADAVARANGLHLAYHNHHFELIPLPDGSLPLIHLRDLTPSSVLFEVDTYWVQTGGANVIDVLRQLGNRAPMLHIKDGPTTLDQPMTAVGTGMMDFPAILAAHKADWLIIEMDRVAGEVLPAVEESLRYLNGLVK